ncbi:regulator of MON1-CCZ1 complex isoform X16 [Mustelus asterias]
MEDKGEVKCIKFSFGNKILAVQRTPKAVDFINFIPDLPQTEYSQECKTKNANILSFCWISTNEIVFITDQGVEFYQVLPDKRTLKLLKNQSINVNWCMYSPETAVLLLSTTVHGNVLQPFYFRSGTMSKMPKFEIELPASPKSGNLCLSDIIMATIYGQLYVLYLKHQPRTPNNPGAEVILYYLPRDGQCKKLHILKLNTTGKFALNVVDNLVVVHHQSSQTSMIFDIKLRAEFDGAVTIHHQVLPSLSIHPCKIPRAGYLWCLQIKLQPIVHMLQDKGRLMDFLLQRKDCKMVILSVCCQMLSTAERGSLPVIATIFDKLNQVYKEYLEAEQNYALAMESGTSRSSSTQKRPVRTQAVIDQSDMYTHVLSVFTEKKACLLLSLESTYPPAHQLSLDMLKVLGALRFVRSVGSHDNISARKFLDAARQTGDTMLFYTTFKFFEQRNQRLRGSSHFTPGEHCEEHVSHFKTLFGEQALLTPMAV